MLRTSSQRENHIRYLGLPRQGWTILVAMLLFSVLVHLASFLKLDYASTEADKNRKLTQQVPIKIKVNPSSMQADKILETKLSKTEKPTNARFKGAQDHKTDKETRVAKNQPRPKAADPGNAAQDSRGKATQGKTAKTSIAPTPMPKQKVEIAKDGTKEMWLTRPKARNKYESLVPSNSELAAVTRAGYQDYVEDALAVGDRIDINTSDYRYIGYFTSMRKAIELVWVYPYDAVRRGLQGEVGLEFTIMKDGTVKYIKVVQSSGFEILDRAIVDAIKLASPFAPLPEGIHKNRLVITGSFRYVLTTSYAGG